MDKSSRIYIAGHTGLVGSAIHRFLKTQGYTNLITKNSKELNLRDQLTTQSFFKEYKPEYVFLAAAKVGGIMANNIYRADFIYDNLLIQNNVIGASYQNGVKKLLFLGSSCIYPKEAPQPISEDALLTGPLEYTNEPYAIAKIAGIKTIESFNIQYGTSYLSVMPTNLYGYNDSFDLEKSHVLPALIRKTLLCKMLEAKDFQNIAKDLAVSDSSEAQIRRSLSKYGIEAKGDTVILKVWGTGKPYREFLHVDDMAEACVFVMNKVTFKDLVKGNEIRNTHINIGTGNDITIKNLAVMIKDMIGFKGRIEFDHSKPDGTMHKLLDVSKLNAIGWKHTIELKTGVARTIEWYKKEAQHGTL
ncbi:MAG TPA: GDP-L-fucose synthase [Candidatus Saccharimonadales bacterium]|nr:GDP-L-fucose synthase [Candidatus Saccharimonadales bacterium]